MRKPTVYVLIACIVVMVVFFIAMEASKRSDSEELGMGWESVKVVEIGFGMQAVPNGVTSLLT